MRKLLFFLVTVLSVQACKKETDYIYEVNPVRVERAGSSKDVQKTMMEFISIAYSDVFGTTITQKQLNDLSILYLSFGDKRLLEDMLIRNLLSSSQINIPSDQQMRSDIGGFVKATYLKLYNREPNELEAFTLGKKISDNTSINPQVVYYAMMTSDEYRFY